MSNSILYYPTIEFRHEDYQWLWNAALFADKIYREPLNNRLYLVSTQ